MTHTPDFVSWGPDDTNAIASALYSVGYNLIQENRTMDAIYIFRTLLSIAPVDERAWLGLASAHELQGDLAVADRILSLSVAAMAQSYRCALAHARFLRRREDDERADDAYETALERARAFADHEDYAAVLAERSCP